MTPFLKNPNEPSGKSEQTWKTKSCFFSHHRLQQELKMLSDNWERPLTINTRRKIVKILKDITLLTKAKIMSVKS